MVRTIVGYHQDDEGHWVAELSCLHNCSLRHSLSFLDRAWMREIVPRTQRIGSPISCPLCASAEMPVGLELVHTIGRWDERTIPRALQRAHRIPEGTWGLLCVTEGELVFSMELSPTEPLFETTLTALDEQPIPPSAVHFVTTTGPVRVELDLFGRASPTY